MIVMLKYDKILVSNIQYLTRGVDLRGGIRRGVVYHSSALRSSVREVEAMDVAVEVGVWVRV